MKFFSLFLVFALLQGKIIKRDIDEVSDGSDSFRSALSSFSTGIEEMTDDSIELVIEGGKPIHFTALTIGTRGDVQPFIALCKRLIRMGHRCRLATHLEY